MGTFTADICGSFLYFPLSPVLFWLHAITILFESQNIVLDCIILMLKQKTELYYGYKNKFVVAYNKIWLYSLKTLFRKYSNYRLKMHIVAQAEEIVHFQEHRKLKV